MRWALIGTSGWADHTFADAIVRADATLVGAAGSTPAGSEAFAARHGTPSTFSDVAELVASDDVDIVWIASSSDLHAQHATDAVRAGKHVLIEKPMARTRAEAEAIAEEARKSDRLVGLGYQHRFHPAHRQLCAIVESGGLGTIGFARFHHMVDYGSAPDTWRGDPERSGGWAVNDLGVHLVDLARFVLGPADTLAARLSSPSFGVATDDLAVLVLGAGATTVVVEVSTGIDLGPSAIELGGTNGSVTLRGSWGEAAELRTPDGVTHFDAFDVHVAQTRDFDAAASRGGGWNGASVEDGVEATRAVETASWLALV